MTPRSGLVRVLGIDPGITRMGYSVVDGNSGDLSVLEQGTLMTSTADPIHKRLAKLYGQLEVVVSTWGPSVVAVERVFLKLNAATAIPSIQAAGLALMLGARSGAAVHQFSPAEVKQAVVGNGSASKEQVRFMVERLVSGDPKPETPDAYDAIAVAITYLNSRKLMLLEESAV